jgi:small conductance mechanosensitive channel
VLHWIRFVLFAVLTATSILIGSEASGQQDEGIGGIFDRILDAEIEPQDMRLYLSPLTASDLKKLAGATQNKVQSALVKAVELNIVLSEAAPERRETIRQEIVENSEAVYDLAAKYRRILNAWDDRGGDKEAILPHRRYLWSLANDLIRTTEFQALWALFGDWLISPSGGIRAIFQLAIVVVWVGGLLAGSALVKGLAGRLIDRSTNASVLLRNFLTRSAYWLTLAIGLVTMLSFFGVRTSPFLAVFGGISFILGFALQDTIGNVASGLMIMISRPFDVGDFVSAGSEAGFVEAMSLVSTKFRTPDNQIIQIPNSRVWSDVIANASASETRRVDLVFGISYSEDASRAIALLERLADEHPLCLPSPRREVFVGELAESSVNIFCRPWVATRDYWKVHWELTAAAKQAFDAAGIAIPFPQVEIHIRPTGRGGGVDPVELKDPERSQQSR